MFWDLADQFGFAPQPTGADGSYSMTGLPAASGDGEVYILVAPELNSLYMLGRRQATWLDPGPTTFDFRPGHVQTNVTLSGSAAKGSGVDIALDGSDAQTPVWTEQKFAMGSGRARTAARLTNAMPGTYSVASCYFNTSKYADRKGEGIESPTTATVTAGELSADTLTFAEADACSVTVATRWASGPPGTSVPVAWAGFPQDWESEFEGVSGYGDAQPQPLGTYPTVGSGSQSFTIPADARPGYEYYFTVQHTDGPLMLEAAFQVCTLKSSKAWIRRGASIRLKGVVPVASNLGRRSAAAKVSIYARFTAAGQPDTYSNPKGWTLAGQARANSKGKYLSSVLYPKRSTYFVVRYSGQGLYWPGYTAVIKVNVH